MPQTSGNLALSQSSVIIRQSETDPNHFAFPGLAVCGNGTLVVAYRVAYQHYGEPSTRIVVQRSQDGGRTWAGPITAILRGTEDTRDVCLSTLSDGRLSMTYSSSAYNAYGQTYVAFSSDNGLTWGTSVQVVSSVFGRPTNAVALNVASNTCGPVIELGDGTLLYAIYGWPAGSVLADPRQAVCMQSTDGGATWTDRSVIYEGSVFLEPFMTQLDNGDIFCGIRTSAEKLSYVKSSDDGATWSSPLTSTSHVSYARPATAQLDNGALAWVSRWGGDCFYRTSWDRGATWSSAGIVDTAYRMVYAQPVQVTSNVMGVVWGMEITDANRSDMMFTYLYDNTLADPFADLAAGDVDGSIPDEGGGGVAGTLTAAVNATLSVAASGTLTAA